MTNEKIIEVLDRYEKVVADMGYAPKQIDLQGEIDMESIPAALAHLRWMVEQTKKYLAEGRREKVMRWLGFMQGAFWLAGVYTLEEMMSHNKPPEIAFDAEK